MKECLLLFGLQILGLVKGTEGTKVKIDLIRNEAPFRIELVRKKVSQVGVVSTSKSMLRYMM